VLAEREAAAAAAVAELEGQQVAVEAEKAGISESLKVIKAREDALIQKDEALGREEASMAELTAELEKRMAAIEQKEERLAEEIQENEKHKAALNAREVDAGKSLEEYRAVLEEIAQARDALKAQEMELRSRTSAMEETVIEIELMQGDLEKDRKLLDQKDKGLEQLRIELERWRQELMGKREQMEEEVKTRVAQMNKEAAAAAQTVHVTSDDLARREIDLRRLEEALRERGRDIETRERTVAVELERLEKERAEVQDTWDKVEASKAGPAGTIDEKAVTEMERRRNELDALYLKISQREEEIHKNEQRLESEWSRLHAIEEELTDLARVLKSKEDEMRKLDGQA